MHEQAPRNPTSEFDDPKGAARKGPVRSPIVVLSPVYNDWVVLNLFLAELNAHFAKHGETASVVVVDDGSTEPGTVEDHDWPALTTIEILRLRRNVGHQRAITLGLAFIEENVPCDAVLVMDADGEDTPEDALRLIAAYRTEAKLVFALRGRRSEGLLFRTFYKVYRFLFSLLTGQAIRFGNFSLVPRTALRRIVAVSEIWNHYASGIQKSRVPCAYVTTSRGVRLAGQSKMNFVSLMTHGLSAISVHAEVVGSRALVFSMAVVGFILAAMGVVVGIRLTTDLAIPGWATYAMGILTLLLAQVLLTVVFFLFVVLNGRNNFSFLPKRDYGYFIGELEQLKPSTAAATFDLATESSSFLRMRYAGSLTHAG